MAMLAEPKRKQKWSLNPRGKKWSEDQNKFGQKMLEKMGWTSGKGLGAQEQGITEHIRVKFKDDQAGIGFNKDDYDKNWLENQSGFNDFLQQLQQNNSENIIENKTENDTENDLENVKGLSGKSLEMKSESSRARVHYKKFTRGKDVNKYKTKDLANILGKKDINEKYVVITEEQTDDVILDPIGSTDRRGGILTIKGGNINDYFKNKMSSISTDIMKRDKSDSESESEQRVGFGYSTSFASNEEDQNKNSNNEKENNTKENEQNTSTKQQSKELNEANILDEVPRKKKKHKKEKEETEFAFENPCLMSVSEIDKQNQVELDETNESEVSRKKKKHKKEKEETEFAFENPCLMNVSEIDEKNQVELNETKESEVSRKKKKHKKEKEETEFAFENPCLMSVSEIDEKNQVELNETNESEVPRKKRKHKKDKEETEFAFENPCLMSVNEIDEQNEAEFEETNESEVSRKKKKHKKEKEETEFAFENPCLMSVSEIDEQNQVELNETNEGEQLETPRRKKKSKKSKHSVENEDSSHYAFENPCLEDITKIDEKPKKPKRNKTKKSFSDAEITDNSKNEVLEEKNNFAFENPCLGDVQVIDNEEQERKKKKRARVEDENSESPEYAKKPKKAKKNKECENDEINAVSEFEVPRKHFGLVNNALDLTDETVGKKRVTFNDKVEYNTDVEKNKKPKTKLDKYEVDPMARKKNIFRGKLVHTKKELKEFFFKNPVLLFAGSNVNELKGYGQ